MIVNFIELDSGLSFEIIVGDNDAINMAYMCSDGRGKVDKGCKHFSN